VTDDSNAAPDAEGWSEPPLAALMSGAARRPAVPMTPERAGGAEWRLALVAAVFVIGFAAVGVRMAALASSAPSEPRVARAAAEIAPPRAEIHDRAGRPLALNLPAWSAYAHPAEIDDPAGAAAALAAALPGVDGEALRARFEDRRGFTWIKRPVTPEERQIIHDLGIPGVYFGDRTARVYPAGRMAAHLLGDVLYGDESVSGAEMQGVSGVERFHDATLRDPARAGAPLRLSLDLAAQAALTEVLRAGVARFNAKGAAATLMDARTGAVVAMASLPDFDPNARPIPTDPAVAASGVLKNRALEGVYEFGSIFKSIFAALAYERGLLTPDSLIDTGGPLFWGRFRIKDDYRMPPQMQVADIIAKSSNVGAARMAIMAGTPAAQEFLGRLGMLDPISFDVAEASLSRPLRPRRWSDLSTITMSYGYGLSVSQLHMAAAYAALVNGGLLPTPSLNPDAAPPGEDRRVISPTVSIWMRDALRATVTRGSGKSAEAPGYEVGGKTGTAEKLAPTGGYDPDRTLASFAGAFPMSDPAYVLVLTLDEPVDMTGPKPRRTAGVTAAPVAGEAIRRVAPLLGLRPAPVVPTAPALTLSSR
jgi:cell division protein FtsI (penicillin-binding protein 3)